MITHVEPELLKVSNLCTYYFSPGGIVKAVDDVSFGLHKGEKLGIAGESGCGKTTCAMSILKLIRPPGRTVRGEVLFEGQDLFKMSDSQFRAIRWKRISIAFQAAMNALNPVIKVKDQIAEAITIHEKIDKSEVSKRVEELLSTVKINPSSWNGYPHEFSGGMKQRAVIAMALACRPSIVILDEPTTALDVVVQAQILKLLHDLCKDMSLSIMLITHDLSIIAEICDTIAIFYAGKIVEYAGLKDFLKHPIHPYSQGLVNAFPKIQSERRTLAVIPGSPPDLRDPPKGCRFYPRCPLAKGACLDQNPPIQEVRPDHYVACHKVDQTVLE